MFTPSPSVCILGFGAFGQLAARYLTPHADLSIHDRSAQAARAASALGYRVIDHPRDITADIIILAVPVPALEGCLRDLAPHLRPGQLVIDTCSIKQQPAQLMQALLPGDVDILATHPMFGPQSARGGLAGCQMVICPIRGDGWRRLAAFLRLRFGLEIVVATPEEHDRQAAMTQGLTHLLARALPMLGAPPVSAPAALPCCPRPWRWSPATRPRCSRPSPAAIPMSVHYAKACYGIWPG